MSLLAQIIDGAAGSEPVASLLRKLQVVASRTGGDPLAEWVGHELSGYGAGTALPGYRGPFNIPALGHFMGLAGSELTGVPIPASTMKEELRESPLFQVSLPHPIAEIEAMSQDTLVFGWDADMVRYYNAGLQNGTVAPVVQPTFMLAEVKLHVPGHVLVQLLDAVRTRVLELALALERVAPNAGQVDASAEDRSEAAEVINNYFLAPSNVAIGSPGASQNLVLPGRGDTDGLLEYMTGIGLDAAELASLRKAIAADEDSGSASSGRWERVRAWFTGAITDVGTGTAAGALASAATSFLGSL